MIPQKPMMFQFAALGYKSHNAEVNPNQDVEMDVALELDAIIENFHFKRWEIDWKAFINYHWIANYAD